MRTRLLFVAFGLVCAAIGVAAGYFIFAPSQSGSASKTSLQLDIADGGVYRVRTVIDGDTVVLENGLHLRYNGMNAPETGRWSKDYSPMSKEATAKNIELVEGKRIRLKLALDPIDMHGRVVANVFVVPDDPGQPEIELREIMIRQGFAKAMNLGLTKEEYAKLKSWQDEAKSAEAGIWGVKNDPKTAEEAKPFCASSTSKIYHKTECHIARRITAANLHEYATAEDAAAVGLKPCATCLGKK